MASCRWIVNSGHQHDASLLGKAALQYRTRKHYPVLTMCTSYDVREHSAYLLTSLGLRVGELHSRIDPCDGMRPSRSCAQTPLDELLCAHLPCTLMLLACGPKLGIVGNRRMQPSRTPCTAVHSRPDAMCLDGGPLSYQAASPTCMPCQHAHACAWEQSHTSKQE